MAVNLEETFVREIELDVGENEDVTLKIYQMEKGDVGCVVWDAALVLVYFISTEKCREKFIKGKHVIELGSGTGVVGLASSVCKAESVTLTDLPNLIPLIKLNIARNTMQNDAITAHALDWFDSTDADKILKCNSDINCLLIADCVYYKEAVEPLVKTISRIFKSSGPDIVAICSYEDRTVGNKRELQKLFQDLLQTEQIFMNFVPLEDMHPVYQSQDIKIAILSKHNH